MNYKEIFDKYSVRECVWGTMQGGGRIPFGLDVLAEKQFEMAALEVELRAQIESFDVLITLLKTYEIELNRPSALAIEKLVEIKESLEKQIKKTSEEK